MDVHWKSKCRNYAQEFTVYKQKIVKQEAKDYPLKPILVKEGKIKHYGSSVVGSSKRGSSGSSRSTSGTTTPTTNDPLGASLGTVTEPGMDPLSMLAAADTTTSASSINVPVTSSRKSQQGDQTDAIGDFEPWSSKRQAILNKYTTCEKLTITTSFLSANAEKVIIKSQPNVTDKVKNRLEQLDDFEDGSVKEMLNLSQQEYVRRIDELNMTMVKEWENDQRVKALKIAIQCSKLLVDTSVIQFYPSKFVLITDILDTFGKLVFNRLYEKAQPVDPITRRMTKLPKQFSSKDVAEQAKETCRNWFYKIASIRELIPRVYVEAAIIKCYTFIIDDEREVVDVLERLSDMCRGIGNPLVATYTASYICRVGMNALPNAKSYVTKLFNDFLRTYSQLQSDVVQNELALQKVDMGRYFTLYSPALDWILQCVAHRADDHVMDDVLARAETSCNSALLLNSIMSAFKPSCVANRAIKLIQMIKDCEDTGLPKYLLYRTLGVCLVVSEPPQDDKLHILNDVWKCVTKLKSPQHYIECAELWIEYVCKHFSSKEVNTLLSDIMRHMLPDRAFEEHYPQLHAVMEKVLANMHDFYILFSMDKFLQFIDLFQKESVKVDVCKMVLSSFCKYQHESTADPVIINATMYLSKMMHDSVNALTVEDERRQIATLISHLVNKVSFGSDLEQQLTFYVECRGAFSSLEPVLVLLIQCVNRVAMQTHSMVNGRHSRKTAAFVRACSAYAFITIPSVSCSVLSKLNLYLLSAQVALHNHCLMQADSFLKACISGISEVAPGDPHLLPFLSSLCSTLLVVPDHPGEGCLYLFRGLLSVVKDYPWPGGQPGGQQQDNKVLFYLTSLSLLAAYTQPTYLYHITGVESNDTLYGGDTKFIAEVNGIADGILSQILQHLQQLGQQQEYKRQSELSLRLFMTVTSCADLHDPDLSKLAVNLWNLSQRHGCTDTRLATATYNSIRRKSSAVEQQQSDGSHGNDNIYDKLIRGMAPLQSRT